MATMVDKDVSMSTRIEITKKYATAYQHASKKPKSRILDTVTNIIGWYCARQVFETVSSLFLGYAARGSWARV